MSSALAPIAALLLALAPSDSARREPEGGWRSIVALDEVTVELDASTVSGSGPFTVLLRWRFADRAVSPDAWDAGVRWSLDLVEVDCRSAATRTYRSVAFANDGAEISAMSFAEASPAWKRARAESVGGMVAGGVCEALRTR